jgi:hypothetical protein
VIIEVIQPGDGNLEWVEVCIKKKETRKRGERRKRKEAFYASEFKIQISREILCATLGMWIFKKKK